jgi:hypothetical protein
VEEETLKIVRSINGIQAEYSNVATARKGAARIIDILKLIQVFIKVSSGDTKLGLGCMWCIFSSYHMSARTWLTELIGRLSIKLLTSLSTLYTLSFSLWFLAKYCLVFSKWDNRA